MNTDWTPYDHDTPVGLIKLRWGRRGMADISPFEAQPVNEETDHYSPMGNLPPKGGTDDEFLDWLNQMGLEFDPFSVRDAGQDHRIPYYMIDHQANSKIRGLNASYVFAPPGGGKSAFRVNLTHACRSNEDDRRVFPIVYKPSESLGVGWQALAQAAAQDLFIFLLYHLIYVVRLPEEKLQSLKQHLEWNLPAPIDLYIDEMRTARSMDPVIDAFDPTARLLPNPPQPEDILEFCDQFEKVPDLEVDRPNPKERFDAIIDFIFNALGAKAIFLLVDGADAFYETAFRDVAAYTYLQWLFENESLLISQKIYPKYFLPVFLKNVIETRMPHLLKSDKKIVMIEWNEDSLIRVIQDRLLVASGGKVKSLDAISTSALRGAEQAIVRSTQPYPRAVIELTEQLLKHHVKTSGPKGRLTPADLKAVISAAKNKGDPNQGEKKRALGGSSGGEGSIDASKL